MQLDDVPPNGEAFQALDIYRSYLRSPYLSVKHSTYFQVYEDLLGRYRAKNITFVEIGVLNGGSLFMWRDYFGPGVRIIGVDLNPAAKRWESDGFEIHIGDQSDPAFWDQFFAEVGDVDVLLDDGGHTYAQQIVTADKVIPHVRDGGQFIVEDTHSSYFSEYGYPSKYSFVEWSKGTADDINARHPGLEGIRRSYGSAVYSVAFFESIVSFAIDRKRCFTPALTFNKGKSLQAGDFRYNDDPLIDRSKSLIARAGDRFPRLKQSAILGTMKDKALALLVSSRNIRRNRKLRRYFR
jgi:hypothetical protein